MIEVRWQRLKRFVKRPFARSQQKRLRLLLFDIQKMRSYDYGITARLKNFPRVCDKIVLYETFRFFFFLRFFAANREIIWDRSFRRLVSVFFSLIQDPEKDTSNEFYTKWHMCSGYTNGYFFSIFKIHLTTNRGNPVHQFILLLFFLTLNFVVLNEILFSGKLTKRY